MIRLPRWVDAVWLIVLAAYTLIGVPGATFHGDEPMQIYMSGDYAVTFIERAPQRLMTQPPYNIDTDPHLRILNGSVNRYSIGFFWQLGGYATAQLPPRPGWDWGLSYADNVATNHRPDERQMLFARLPSALFLCASYAVLFALAERIGGRGLAYAATALYALNPAILLNGRRALQESAMLCFGLLSLYAAQRLAASVQPSPQLRTPNPAPRTQNSEPRTSPLSYWLTLTLAAGLTLASKHSGIVFVAAAFGWLLIALLRSLLNPQNPEANPHSSAFRTVNRELRTVNSEPRTQPPPSPLRALLALTASGVGALALFLLLSPALWSDPPARVADLLAVRAQLIDIQVAADPVAPMTLEQRLTAIITQPFIAPVAHYEAAPFDVPPINEEAARYMASPLSGLQFGPILGGLLTLLAIVGAITIAAPRWSPVKDRASAVGLLIWLAVIIASLLANPLPWQRYYLPLIPLAALLAGLGGLALVRRGRNIYTKAPVSAAQ